MPLHADDQQLVAAHRVDHPNVSDGNPGDLRQPLPNRLRHDMLRSGALFARLEFDVDARVVFAQRGAGIDGGVGVEHLGQLAQGRIDLTGLGFGQIERRADRCLKAHQRLGVIGLRHKLGAEQRHQRKAAEKSGSRDDERHQPMPQRPAEQALVKGG